MDERWDVWTNWHIKGSTEGGRVVWKAGGKEGEIDGRMKEMRYMHERHGGLI